MTSLSAVPFALICMALSAGAASAQSATDHDPNVATFAQDVRYTNDSLASPQGRRQMLMRIEIAADAVCGGAPSASSGYSARLDYLACKQAAMADAVGRIHSPMLAAQLAGDHMQQMAGN